MKNTIITLILIIFIGLVGFWYLTKTDSSTAYLNVDKKTTDSIDAKYIYSILQQMSQVNLDDSIFTDSTFQSLKDNTATLAAQSSGRNNPFAPVGSDANISSQQTQNTPASSSQAR